MGQIFPIAFAVPGTDSLSSLFRLYSDYSDCVGVSVCVLISLCEYNNLMLYIILVLMMLMLKLWKFQCTFTFLLWYYYFYFCYSISSCRSYQSEQESAFRLHHSRQWPRAYPHSNQSPAAGVCATYKFRRSTEGESLYYSDMQSSYFAVTKRKNGWDWYVSLRRLDCYVCLRRCSVEERLGLVLSVCLLRCSV